MKRYQAPKQALWSGRVDHAEYSAFFRLHQIVEQVDLEKEQLPTLKQGEKGIAILGFACDEGVRRNKGRVGAAEGPDSIVKILSSFAVNFEGPVRLCSVGSVDCSDGDLDASHKKLADLVALILEHNYFPLLLGGGHDIAWPHFQGIGQYLKKRDGKQPNIGIINFDAHFDIRSYEDGASSGSPFLQIADWCEQEKFPFSYLCLGLQKSGNTKALFQTAEKLGVSHVSMSEIQQKGMENLVKQVREFIKGKDHLYVTICLDVFAAPFAPGVSATACNGMLPETFFSVLERIVDRETKEKLIGFNIAELSPKYDIDNHTARLASAMVYEVIDKLTLQ